MVGVDKGYNQLKVATLYRIISKIQLPTKNRIRLINSIIKNSINFSNIINEVDLYSYLDKYLNDQEKNIFRFSLMKDLINIMKADYVETDGEKDLLQNIKDYFNISHEQFSFFIKEYERDRSFFAEDIRDIRFKNMIINTISAGAALGIPLATFYHSGTYKRRFILRTISGLDFIKVKRRKTKKLSSLDMMAYVLLGITTYKTLQSILNIKKDNKTKLIELVKKDIGDLHEVTRKTIYYDLEYFTNRIAELKDTNSHDFLNLQKIVDILERSSGTLEATGPIIL